MTKPPACSACPLVKQSTGFCGDHVPSSDHGLVMPTRAKLAIVLRMPSKADLVREEAMSGPAAYHFWKDFIWARGWQKEDVLIANVIRCYPNTGEYPIGKLRVQATAKCAELWDASLTTFAPNVWGISISPTMLYATPNQAKFLHRAFDRARDYIRAGKRPCLLLGPEAMGKFAPWLQGSMKQWQGHWWEEEEKRDAVA